MPRAERMLYVADAFRHGMQIEQVFDCCKIDPWFLAQIKDLVDEALRLADRDLKDLSAAKRRGLKRNGFAHRRA